MINLRDSDQRLEFKSIEDKEANIKLSAGSRIKLIDQLKQFRQMEYGKKNFTTHTAGFPSISHSVAMDRS